MEEINWNQNEKLKVLIVEDEEILWRGLTNILNWDALGFEICGMAKTFDEAVSIAHSKRPDVLITDIMLGANQKTGLDLIKQFSVLLPQMRSILLTGHDNFDYAQDAIGYTVKAYLLKPVSAQILEQNLVEVRIEIVKKRMDENRRKALVRQLQSARPFLFDWFLTFTGTPEHDMMFGESRDKRDYQIVIVRFSDSAFIQPLFELFLKVEDMYQCKGRTAFTFFSRNHYIIVLEMQSETMLCDGCEINTFVQELQDFLDFSGRDDFVIGVGPYSEDPQSLRDAYEQAFAMSEYGEFIGGCKQVYYNDLLLAKPQLIPRFDSIRIQLRLAIQTGHYQKAVESVCSVMREAAQKGADISTLRSLAFESFVILDEVRSIVGIPSEGEDVLDWSSLDHCKNLDDLLHCLTTHYSRIGLRIISQRESRNFNKLDQIKQIIDTQYSQNLSLDSLAKKVYMSTPYLSALFSERFKTTFKNYLTSVRIDMAKKYLVEGEQKIYAIAEQVGYSDTRYFSQVFRKYTGMTPIAYRNQEKN